MAAPAIKMLMAAAGAATTPTVSSAILALSPVGYWKLNDPSGTTAADSSGNGRNGTYIGSGYTLGGAAGGDGANYADFGNGASSYVELFDMPQWSWNNSGSGMSIFALIKPDSVAGTTRQFIIAKDGTGGSDAEWGFAVNDGAGGRINGRIWTGAGFTIMGRKTANGTAGTAWQAVCFTAGTPATGDPIQIYRNSNTNLDDGTESGQTGTPYSDLTAGAWIGWRGDSPANQYWQGGLAHVAIFPTKLNTTQVQSLMTAADNDGWF